MTKYLLSLFDFSRCSLHRSSPKPQLLFSARKAASYTYHQITGVRLRSFATSSQSKTLPPDVLGSKTTFEQNSQAQSDVKPDNSEHEFKVPTPDGSSSTSLSEYSNPNQSNSAVSSDISLPNDEIINSSNEILSKKNRRAVNKIVLWNA
jgi:hypothetical protein